MASRRFLRNQPLWLAAVASGALLALSFPLPGWGFLAWIALVPLMAGCSGHTTRHCAVAGWLCGMIFFVGSLSWLTHTMTRFGNMPFILAVALLGLLGAYLSVYVALFAAALRWWELRAPSLRWLAAPAVWMALELLRAWALTGFPWQSLGYSQHDNAVVRQVAALVGVYGLSGLIVLVNAALAEIALAVRQPRRWLPAAITAAAAMAGAVAYGLPFANPAPQPGPDESATVAIIQGNIPQSIKWNPSYREFIFTTYLTLSAAAVAEGAEILVWPEASLPTRFNRFNTISRRLRSFAEQEDVPILFGSSHRDDAEYLNASLILDRNGSLTGFSGKRHLVPFGEYVPLENSILFWVERMVHSPSDFTPGRDYSPLEALGAKWGSFVCYEVVFPDLVRRLGQSSNVLVNITNEAWFGRTSATYQMVSMAQMRAVENRLPLVRSANTGISTFIDPHGQVIGRTTLEEAEWLIADIPTGIGGGQSLYSRWGNWLPLGAGGLVVGAMFALTLKRRLALPADATR